MIGDQLLVAIAQRLDTCLRLGDTIARLGGDEFAILLDHIETSDDATEVTERIHQALKLPFNLSGHEVFTSASIGVALSSAGYNYPEELLRDADTATYRAKEQGRACHAVFDRDMYDRAVALLQLETDLRWSIERRELRVYYQPIISLVTGKITGFESLVRWQHPERGLLSPIDFISVAEETGLIIAIDQWVLFESCHQLSQWQRQFPEHLQLTISVNLSSRLFSQPNLIQYIQKILQQTKLDASTLRLEITESAIMNHPQHTATILQQLRDLRIKLSLDDFGTGYSSLSYLHRFPINTLKIDQSFVHQIDQKAEQLAIVRAIVTLASNLGMDVVAEGVETTQQLSQLKNLQCEYGQGFLFSEPLNSEMASLLIASSPHW